MSNLIKSDEIWWEDFEIIGVTTNTPDYHAKDGQVLVQAFYSSGLTGLNHLPAYLEDGGDDPEGIPKEIVRWYWGEEMVAESLDLAVYIRGDEFEGQYQSFMTPDGFGKLCKMLQSQKRFE